MISFIVIGKNEGWKLTRSVQSIIDAIAYNDLIDYEIIYVDSDSSDDSIMRIDKFNYVTVYKLTGELNAGIARNVGAQKSKGDTLFFIDGDMEIHPKFLSLVYSMEKGLIHDFVSGNWVNYYYNASGELLRKENYREMKADCYEKVTGGFFLIKKKMWDLVDGINENFKISEDIDIGLRLARKGTFLLRKKEIGVTHHTIDYFDNKRMWKDFLSMNHLFGRSFLYRNHLLNKYVYARLIRNDYTLLILITSILAFIFFPLTGIIIISIYLIFIMIRGKLSIQHMLYYFLRDLTTLLGFFFFFPRKNHFSINKIK